MDAQDGGRPAWGGHDICVIPDGRQPDVALPTVHPDGRLAQLHERGLGDVVQDLSVGPPAGLGWLEWSPIMETDLCDILFTPLASYQA